MGELVLVTGGSGVLGRAVVALLLQVGYGVRILSRRPPSLDHPGAEWVQGDLATGEGVAQALEGASIVVHAATSPSHSAEVDLAGTARLLAEARAASVRHLLYISIAGCDRIPLRYYQHKASAERLVEAGDVPWSILRIAQFHTLLDAVLSAIARLPVMPLPMEFRFQPIAPEEAAVGVVEAVRRGPAGRLPVLVGPRVYTGGELVREWLAVRGLRRLLLPLPLPGRLAAAFRAGYNTAPESPGGATSWGDWLRQRYKRGLRDV